MTKESPPDSQGLEDRPAQVIVQMLLAGQKQAVQAVEQVQPQIVVAAELIAKKLRQGGRLVYVGAGASFGQGLQDGRELPGTFGLDEQRLVFLQPQEMLDEPVDQSTEDDCEKAVRDADALKGGDVIIAISASGTTPYTLSICQLAKDKTIAIVALVNQRQSALGEIADIEIMLDTGPEVIAGSTRLGAGTAQKITLNLLSSLAMIKLNTTCDGLMVTMQANNVKLRQRAVSIIVQLAEVDEVAASAALNLADNSVKEAVLIAAGADSVNTAQRLLRENDGHLRAALTRLG